MPARAATRLSSCASLPVVPFFCLRLLRRRVDFTIAFDEPLAPSPRCKRASPSSRSLCDTIAMPALLALFLLGWGCEQRCGSIASASPFFAFDSLRVSRCAAWRSGHLAASVLLHSQHFQYEFRCCSGCRAATASLVLLAVLAACRTQHDVRCASSDACSIVPASERAPATLYRSCQADGAL